MHMLVLDYVISRKTVSEESAKYDRTEGSNKGYDCRKGMSEIWIDQMLERLPLEYQKYAEWPVNFVRGLNYSFEQDHDVWRPFLLNNGTATMPSERGTLSTI